MTTTSFETGSMADIAARHPKAAAIISEAAGSSRMRATRRAKARAEIAALQMSDADTLEALVALSCALKEQTAINRLPPWFRR